MRTTFNTLFFLKKSGLKKDGTMPIKARVTINGTKTSKHMFMESMERLSDHTLLFCCADKADEQSVLKDLVSDLNKMDEP